MTMIVLEFGTDEFYVKSTDEMYELFSAHGPKRCENTEPNCGAVQF